MEPGGVLSPLVRLSFDGQRQCPLRLCIAESHLAKHSRTANAQSIRLLPNQFLRRRPPLCYSHPVRRHVHSTVALIATQEGVIEYN